MNKEKKRNKVKEHGLLEEMVQQINKTAEDEKST
jgi:hypothetical protein